MMYYKWWNMLFSVNEFSVSSFCFLAGGLFPIVTLFLLVSVRAWRFGLSPFSGWKEQQKNYTKNLVPSSLKKLCFSKKNLNLKTLVLLQVFPP